MNNKTSCLYCDDAFFQPDWAGAYWGRWVGDRTAAGLVLRLWMWHTSAKTRKKVGRQGLRPWLIRCLSQFLAERKDRLLRGQMFFLPPFHRGGGLLYIAYVFPIGWE